MILQRFGTVPEQCDWWEGWVSVKITGLIELEGSLCAV